MRVTNDMLYNTLTQNINSAAKNVLDAENTVATEKIVNSVSDDPSSASRIMDLENQMSRVNQYDDNVTQLSALASVQSDALSQVSDLITSAKSTLLTESSEATSTADSREAARIKISTLVSQLVQLANTTYNGASVFSGSATDATAFTDAAATATASASNTGGATVASSSVADSTLLTYDSYKIQFTGAATYNVVDATTGATVLSNQKYVSGQAITFSGVAVTLADGASGGPAAGDVFTIAETAAGTYQGNSQVMKVAIQDGQTVASNLTGNAVFQGVGSADGVDIFSVMQQIQTALANNDQNAMSSLLDNLDSAKTQILNAETNVGAKQDLLDNVQSSNEDQATQLDSVRSTLQDADVTTAATSLTQAQTAYEAVLSSVNYATGKDLFDFLT
jgi:flagellar hook-associated protein 3 FlgL